MDRWSANITQSASKHRNVGGVGIYVCRPRWHGSGCAIINSKDRNVGGIVGGLGQNKMAITPSSAYHGKIP